MFRLHEIRGDVEETELRDFLESIGLAHLLPEKELRDGIDYGAVNLKKLGLDITLTVEQILEQIALVIESYGTRNEDAMRFVFDIRGLIDGFRKTWNKDIEKTLNKKLKPGMKMEFITQLKTTCFWKYVSNRSTGFTSNLIVQTYSDIMVFCQRWKGQNAIWKYTRQELESSHVAVLQGPGKDLRYSFLMSDDLKKKILEEQSVLDKVVKLLKFIHIHIISEKQIRLDLHSLAQNIIQSVIDNKLYEFDLEWSDYFERGTIKAKTCREIVQLLAPFYGLPTSLEDYNATENKAVSVGEYYDAMTKLISRRFKRPGTNRQKK